MSKDTRQQHDQSGQSLIEVVVALVVVGLVAIGLIKISSTSVRNARYSSEQTGAVALGEKKIAEVKASAINDSDNFWVLPKNDNGFSGIYCYLVQISDIKYDPIEYLPTETPNYINAGLAKVVVTVYWESVDSSPACNTAEVGSTKYRRNVNFTTLITK